MSTTYQHVLGIDPGSIISGFAVIGFAPDTAWTLSSFRVVDAGVMRLSAKEPINQRLSTLHKGLFDLMQEYRPVSCVLESAFFGINAQSALKLGMVRGAFISAASRLETPIAEITPAQVKKTIAGHGRADKEEVSLAVERLFGIRRGQLPYDATDAIAIAASYLLQANHRLDKPSPSLSGV